MTKNVTSLDSAGLDSIALDLQILICTLLHPADILALRQTCKTLQLATRKRAVWVAAIHQICFDNSLFLPSFPIVDMSDAELEHAAMGPRRWIELCAGFEKQHPNDSGNNSGATLLPRTTRAIEDPYAASTHPTLFIVPGGRYMVSNSVLQGISVWDLGYTSSTDCKLIASLGPEDGSDDCFVQPTSNGMGLIIFSCRYDGCFVHEIYPQSKTPQLTHIAHVDYEFNENPWVSAYLLPDRVLWYDRSPEDRIIFVVWDYRANHSICFSPHVDIKHFGHMDKVVPTKTAIIIISREEILVWAIPPLLPQPPNFTDHNPIRIPPLLRMAFPDGIVRDTGSAAWRTMSHWYFGSSQPIYFDTFCGSKLHRLEIIVKPDLLDTSIRIISTLPVPRNFFYFNTYRICEDTVVACWEAGNPNQFGAYTGSTSSRFIPHGGPAVTALLPPSGESDISLCPTSGRYVYVDRGIWRIVVVDLL